MDSVRILNLNLHGFQRSVKEVIYIWAIQQHYKRTGACCNFHLSGTSQSLYTLNAKRNAIEVQNDFNYVFQHFILYVQMDQLSRKLEQTVSIKCSFIHVC